METTIKICDQCGDMFTGDPVVCADMVFCDAECLAEFENSLDDWGH